MRLSVISSDRGYAVYKALPAGVRPFVTVNGAEVPMVVTADDRQGYVLAVDADADGQVRLNARRNRVLRKQMRGDVRIELRRMR